MNIAVIGTGAYSIAIISVLQKNNFNKLNVWTHDENYITEYKKTKKLNSIIKTNELNINLSTDLKHVIDNCKIIYIGVTSLHFTKIIKKIKPYYTNQSICIVTKGIDDETNLFFTDIVKEILGDNVSILSGPSFAIDIINDDITELTLASTNEKNLNLVELSLDQENFKIETTSEDIAVQLLNTIKNVVAIASGMLSEMGYSNSTNAYLIKKVLNETKKILKDLNQDENSVLLSAGIGDMILTCTSQKSRNYTFGVNYIKTNSVNLEKTAEGYYALHSLNTLLSKKNIKSEFITTLYSIIYEKNDKKLLIEYLK